MTHQARLRLPVNRTNGCFGIVDRPTIGIIQLIRRCMQEEGRADWCGALSQGKPCLYFGSAPTSCINDQYLPPSEYIYRLPLLYLSNESCLQLCKLESQSGIYGSPSLRRPLWHFELWDISAKNSRRCLSSMSTTVSNAFYPSAAKGYIILL